MPGHSCQRTCPLWWAPLVLERGGDRSGLAQPWGACVAGGRAGHQVGSLRNASHTMAYGGVGLVPSYTGLVGRGRADASSAPSTNTVISPTSRSSSGGCRRWSAASSSDTPPRVRGPRLVQVRGRVLGVARPEGVQQGWGAAVEGHGRPCSRQPQGVPHGQGLARPVGLAPLHPVPVEGRLRDDEPRLDGVHDPVHRREQRRGPRSVQGADGREGGLVEESPRTARQVTPCGSVRLVRLRHRVRHQAPDGRLLRFAAGPGVSRPITPSAWHGTAGSAKGGGGRGSGREHVRQVRN